MPYSPGERKRRPESATAPRPGERSIVTTDTAEVLDLDDLLEDAPPDDAVVQMARQIAARLSIRRRPRRARGERGIGALAPVSYRYRSDDIDLDRTIDVLAERPFPDDTDIVVRERTGEPRAVALIVDVSGSMKGEKAHMAVATVAALAGDFRDDQLAVVAFWSDAALLKPLNTPVSTTAVLDQLLRIPTRGLTNIDFGLSVAEAEIGRSTARRRTAILLTDALHNAGPDPRQTAGHFCELHVLVQTDGNHDRPLATDMARRGHGRIASAATYRDVAPALNYLLAP